MTNHGPKVILLATLALFAACANPAFAQQSKDRFIELARSLHNKPPKHLHDTRVAESMEIVLDSLAKLDNITQKTVNDVTASFQDKLDVIYKSDEFRPATEFGWIASDADEWNHQRAISVTYGSVSRTVVIDTLTGKRIPLPVTFSYFAPWHSKPIYMKDGTLLLASTEVIDMGNRIGLHVDLLFPKNNQYQTARSWQMPITLDFGGWQVKGNEFTLTYIDLPKSFDTFATDTLFKRNDTYRVAGGSIFLLRSHKAQPELRFLDGWMLAARTTRKPDSMQRRFRRFHCEMNMLDKYSVAKMPGNRTRVCLDLDENTFRFVIAKTRTNYRIIAFSGSHLGQP